MRERVNVKWRIEVEALTVNDLRSRKDSYCLLNFQILASLAKICNRQEFGFMKSTIPVSLQT